MRVLGTPVKTIRDTEDRKLFIERLAEIGVATARSRACRTADEARAAAREIGFPVMLRGGFALGGQGSGIVETETDLDQALRRAFAGGVPQVLVEESLRGWKEIEYEVVRDGRDNCITVCNMENLDPMGIHTGESIVVAPTPDAQRRGVPAAPLGRDQDHPPSRHRRRVQHPVRARPRGHRLPRHRGQRAAFALERSCQQGHRLSRSPTSPPRSLWATRLPEIPNAITRRTTAFFEPALDYLVCKVPRWDLAKFRGASMRIGTEMKSVGEVMAIGRTFPEVIQKALRMLDIGVEGLDPDAFEFDDLRGLALATLRRCASSPWPRRCSDGMTVERIHELTRIDPWFLHAIEPIVADAPRAAAEVAALRRDHPARGQGAGLLRPQDRPAHAGTARAAFALSASGWASPRTWHRSTRWPPSCRRRPTTSIPPTTPERPTSRPRGARRSWCWARAPTASARASSSTGAASTLLKAARELGYETLMVNYNPETVSTDYDECDKLIFDEVSFETVLEIYEREQPYGVVVSDGRAAAQQPGHPPAPRRGAHPGHQRRVHRHGRGPAASSAPCSTSSASTSRAGSTSPTPPMPSALWSGWAAIPVLVRPSYVLSGAAMSVAREKNELARILARAKAVSPEHPVVISKFETHARELEIDAVADGGEIVLWAISEHVEDAGVHSRRCHAGAAAADRSTSRPSARRARSPQALAQGAARSPARSTCSFWPSTTR